MNLRATVKEQGDNYQITFHDYNLGDRELDLGFARVIDSARAIQAQYLESALGPFDFAKDLVEISDLPCLQVVDVEAFYAGGERGTSKTVQMQVPATYIADVSSLLAGEGWNLETEDSEAFVAPKASRLADIETVLTGPCSKGTGLGSILYADPFLLNRFQAQPNAGKFIEDPRHLTY